MALIIITDNNGTFFYLTLEKFTSAFDPSPSGAVGCHCAAFAQELWYHAPGQIFSHLWKNIVVWNISAWWRCVSSSLELQQTIVWLIK